MKKQPRLRAAILISVLVATVLSGAIHEFGHALAAAAQGLKVTEIQPFWFLGPPHIHMEGAATPRMMAVINIAGMLSVVAVSLLGMILIPFHLLDRKVAVVLAIIFPALFGQLLAWIFLPWLLFSGGKVSDDVASFIAHTGIHPLWVSGFAFLLLAICVTVFFVRTHFLSNLRAIKKGGSQLVRLPFQNG